MPATPLASRAEGARAHLAVSVAVVVGLAPAIAWATSAGAAVLGWHGVAMVAGFGAVGLFGVSMVLVLRVAWLDRAFFGLAALYRAHHAIGTAAFLLVLLHPIALALAALPRQPSRALGLLLLDPSSPSVISGFIALLLFVAFFVATVAERVPYQLWRRVHRASGLAYVAMVWHLVDAQSGSVATGFGLALIAAGALGYVHRVLTIDASRQGLRYRVVEVRHRAPNVVDLVLEPRGEALRFEPGQFVYLALRDSPSYRACGELHPYTLTGRPGDPRLRLSIKALGDCTRHIQEVTVAIEAVVQGPFGALFPRGARRAPQVWVGGGIGITPFLGRASALAPGGPPIDVVYAAPNEGAALYLDDLRELERAHPELHVHTIFEDSDGLPRAEDIRARVGSLDEREVVLAGPAAMVTALKRQLTALGVPAASIHSEEGLTR